MDARSASGLFSWLAAFASAAALLGVFPQRLSEHKAALYLVAGTMLVVAGGLQLKVRLEPAPVEPQLAVEHDRARRISMHVYRMSIVIFAVGYYFAFMTP